MKRVDHGPRCIACTDPAEAARQIAVQRAQLDVEAEAARQCREHSDRVKAEWYHRPGLSAADFGAVQSLVIEAARTANVIMQGVLVRRGHLDRVEAAHPAVAEHLALRAAS